MVKRLRWFKKNYWTQRHGDLYRNQRRNPKRPTSSPQGITILQIKLKGFDEKGFVFYTNFLSQKSKEMTENPNVCMVFFWDALSRVVRIQGKAAMQEDKEANDQYFHSRPRDAQIASASSKQSHVVDGGREKVQQNYEVKLYFCL